jgi:ElaB/YqjD/DUF883 family membrane-anchored ribosome-binding protein
MPDSPGPPRFIGNAKETLAVAREALIVLAFLLLVCWPTAFNGILERAGFIKGSLMGFEWENKVKASTEQAKGAGDAITRIQEQLQTLQKALEGATGPNAAALKGQVTELLVETRKADEATKNSLVAQQRLIAEVAPSAVTSAGWIYLGKTTSAQDRWLGEQTVDGESPSALKPGTTVRVRDDVYIRDNDGRDPRNLGRVVGVVPGGERVVVQEVRYQPRPAFVAVWAQVTRR